MEDHITEEVGLRIEIRKDDPTSLHVIRDGSLMVLIYVDEILRLHVYFMLQQLVFFVSMLDNARS